MNPPPPKVDPLLNVDDVAEYLAGAHVPVRRVPSGDEIAARRADARRQAS